MIPKYKVTFLLDKNNNWFDKYLRKTKLNKKKYIFKFFLDYKKIKKQNIVMILSYTKILPSDFLNKNELNVVIHSSKLPEDKGFAPLSYQILKGKNKIYNTMFKVSEKVDSGPIIMRNSFNVKRTDLYLELRKKQAISIIKMIRNFLDLYPNLKYTSQKGSGSFNKKRSHLSSKLNINKSIKSQFNLLRTCDNENFPAFFNLNKKKYILKIFQDKKKRK